MGYENSVKPFYYFLPLSAANWSMPFDNTFAENMAMFPDTRCIHFSNEMLREVRFNKDAAFAPDCLFEQLKAKHSIKNTATTETTIADVKEMMAIREKVRTKRKAKEKNLLLVVALIIVALVVSNVIG